MKGNPPGYSDEKAYRIAYLVAGFIRKTLTEVEHDELDQWVEASDENMLLFEELTDEKNIEANLAWMERVQTETALKKTSSQLQFTDAVKIKIRIAWPFIAAACLLAVLIGIYILWPAKTNSSITTTQVANSDVQPGGNKARLTLSDGTVIDLTKKSTGLIKNEKGTMIEKTGDGAIMYEKLSEGKEAAFNQIDIPRGGQFILSLSDGTKVWMNALSTLKFPEQFTGSERVVELSGEAFFDVAKDQQHPFVVRISDKDQVRVLGTQFNVFAYHDEDTKKITLVEGSVDVSNQTSNVKIRPGQQALISNVTISVEKHADVESVTGWKDGRFVFRDADIYNIMRQAERWYDVNVIYRRTSSQHFNFSISRNEPLSKLLHLMELTGKIHFKTENKTVYVLP